MTVWYDEGRGRWRYDFQLAGVRHARECLGADGRPVTSKRTAQDCEDEARRIAKIAPKLTRANDLTVAMVLDRLSDDWMKEADWPNKQRYIRELRDFFGYDTLVRDIDDARLDDYKTHLLSRPLLIWTGGNGRRRDAPDADKYWHPHPSGKTRGAATVNRYLPVVRAMFERAYKTRDPITQQRGIEEVPEIDDLKEPKRKARPAPDAVISDLFQILPEYLIEAIRLTLYFGLRAGEAFPLRVHQVDFQERGIRLDCDEVKDKEDAFLPGSRDAMQFLAQLVDQAKDRGSRYLIAYRRPRKKPDDQAREKWRPIKRPKTAWKNAMDKIEASHGRRWRWHDLRAAFITNIAVNAGPVAAQKLARHSDFSTTQGYIEVADEVTRAAVEKASERPALSAIKGGKF